MTVVLGSNDVAHTTMGIGIEAAGLTLIIKFHLYSPDMPRH